MQANEPDGIGLNAASGDAGDAETSLDLLAGAFRSGGPVEIARIQMQRRSFGLQNTHAKFTEIDGLAIFEGDIILGTADEARGITDPGERGLGAPPKWRWKTKTIPYTAEAGVQTRVERAIAHWQEHTPFRFVPRTVQKDYIAFVVGTSCRSNIGRQGGMQRIILGKDCTVGNAIHEIGHALGLWHEQSRSDRDNFIEIITENIDPALLYNFEKQIQNSEDLGAYDFGSIMHYPATAFSINDKPTIRVKGGAEIGQRNGLSTGDIAAIRLMYPDLDWPA